MNFVQALKGAPMALKLHTHLQELHHRERDADIDRILAATFREGICSISVAFWLWNKTNAVYRGNLNGPFVPKKSYHNVIAYFVQLLTDVDDLAYGTDGGILSPLGFIESAKSIITAGDDIPLRGFESWRYQCRAAAVVNGAYAGREWFFRDGVVVPLNDKVPAEVNPPEERTPAQGENPHKLTPIQQLEAIISPFGSIRSLRLAEHFFETKGEATRLGLVESLDNDMDKADPEVNWFVRGHLMALLNTLGIRKWEINSDFPEMAWQTPIALTFIDNKDDKHVVSFRQGGKELSVTANLSCCWVGVQRCEPFRGVEQEAADRYFQEHPYYLTEIVHQYLKEAAAEGIVFQAGKDKTKESIYFMLNVDTVSVSVNVNLGAMA